MSALAEALLAAQRQAVGVLAKVYVAGNVDDAMLVEELEKIGCTDMVDQSLLVNALNVVKEHGGEAPKPTGATSERKAPEQATDSQKSYIAKLCKERNVPEPDTITSKDRASEIIEALKAGTYNPDAYTVPF